ncbi:hypothetical protein OHA21_05210 [Actinoplanes sp. NBC_00393]|uniref:hypothetical protein n=1 Tax=Actinoplanes sp. NBC_00393 TaxID=2975953 RepID=UPI002E21879B
MDHGGSNTADLRRYLEDAAYRARRTTDEWRDLADARLTRIPEPPTDRDEPPDDAPPQYRDVLARLDRGELEWSQLMDPDIADPDCRAVAAWLDRRMRIVEDACWSARHGTPFDEAYDAAVRRAGR